LEKALYLYVSGIFPPPFEKNDCSDLQQHSRRKRVLDKDASQPDPLDLVLREHVMVYYVIAMALYMHSSCREVLRCLLEGVQWLLDPSATIKVTGKSGISQARTRLAARPGDWKG
jgi:hypothetical protein